MTHPFEWPQYVAVLYLFIEVVYFSAKAARDFTMSSGTVALAILMKIGIVAVIVFILSAGGFW